MTGTITRAEILNSGMVRVGVSVDDDEVVAEAQEALATSGRAVASEPGDAARTGLVLLFQIPAAQARRYPIGREVEISIRPVSRRRTST